MKDNYFVSGVIVAAGSGARMGHIQKPLIKLGNKTAFEHVFQAFCDSCVDEIVIVCRSKSDYLPLIPKDTSKPVIFAEGGDTRAFSVYNGVTSTAKKYDPEHIVCIHDSVRPFVTPDLIDRVVQGAKRTGAATASHIATDTMKYINIDAGINYTPDRNYLRSIQTPQAFRKDIYTLSFMNAQRTKLTSTDETSMAEHASYPVEYIDSDELNIKLTTPKDIKLAKAIFFLDSRGELD